MTKARFIAALPGTGGIRSEIAKALGTSATLVRRLLARNDWQDVWEEVERTAEEVTDESHNALRYAINQRFDLPTAVASAKWYLSKRMRDVYGEETRLTVQGGDKPIRTQNANVTIIDVSALDLPISVQRLLLEAVESKEKMKPADTAPQESLALPAPVVLSTGLELDLDDEGESLAQHAQSIGAPAQPTQAPSAQPG